VSLRDALAQAGNASSTAKQCRMSVAAAVHRQVPASLALLRTRPCEHPHACHDHLALLLDPAVTWQHTRCPAALAELASHISELSMNPAKSEHCNDSERLEAHLRVAAALLRVCPASCFSVSADEGDGPTSGGADASVASGMAWQGGAVLQPVALLLKTLPAVLADSQATWSTVHTALLCAQVRSDGGAQSAARTLCHTVVLALGVCD
jgi:hypothetical protein